MPSESAGEKARRKIMALAIGEFVDFKENQTAAFNAAVKVEKEHRRFFTKRFNNGPTPITNFIRITRFS